MKRVAARRVAFAVAAHPDDIEFLMAGTLLLLGGAGYELHYMNLSTGNCGTVQHSPSQIRRIRKTEGAAAARILGAQFHAPIADDLEILYNESCLRKLAAVMRQVQPSILLIPSPQDYMEDHVNTCRLAVTAAFARGMRNFRTTPPESPIDVPVTVYHAMPHGLHDMLGARVRAGIYVNTASVLKTKEQALLAHRSQSEWLDRSQGPGSYVEAMVAMSRELGRLSGKFQHAEAWRPHSHLGFCDRKADPLSDALASISRRDAAYFRKLEQGY